MKQDDVRAQVAIAVQACMEKKAEDISILRLDAQASGFTDYFVICSGANPRQVQAIGDEVDEKLSKLGYEPSHVEGRNQAEWLLLDYVDFVVHIFSESARKFYDLERLWKTATRLQLGRLGEAGAEESSSGGQARACQESGEESGRRRRTARKKTVVKRAKKGSPGGETSHCLDWQDAQPGDPIAYGRVPEASIALRGVRCAGACVGGRVAEAGGEECTGRTQPVLVLLDARGKQLASEEIANFLDYHLSHDTQDLLFADRSGGWMERCDASSGQACFVVREDHAAA